jgi:hypothetical protein
LSQDLVQHNGRIARTAAAQIVLQGSLKKSVAQYRSASICCQKPSFQR